MISYSSALQLTHIVLSISVKKVTKLSQPPTKHSTLTSPSICTIFSMSKPTLALVLLPLSHSNTYSFLSSQITDISLTHHAPVQWNALPKEFRQPAIYSSHASQFGFTLLLDLSISQFHSKLKTYLFYQSFPPYSVSRIDYLLL